MCLVTPNEDKLTLKNTACLSQLKKSESASKTQSLLCPEWEGIGIVNDDLHVISKLLFKMPIVKRLTINKLLFSIDNFT